MPVGRKLGPTVEHHRVSSPGTHRSGGGKTLELLPFVADSSPRSAAVRQRRCVSGSIGSVRAASGRATATE